MIHRESLDGTWQLLYAEDSPDYYCGPTLKGRRPLCAEVPEPVHLTLIRAGILEDLNVGMNSLKARWVEEAFWIYRRSFEASAIRPGERAWIVLRHVECDAVVWLNGIEIGRHCNAHRPARFEVTTSLREGTNLLVVRTDAGLQSTLDRSASEYHYDWFARMTKRAWLRKPQYQCGWDWNPRMMNVGILGPVWLERASGPVLRDVTVFALPSDDLSSALIVARATLDTTEPCSGEFRIKVRETGQSATSGVDHAEGGHRVEATLTMDRPALWWPIGHGEQPLYHVEAAFLWGGTEQHVTRRTGVRRVTMDQSPHPESGRHCILTVNNRPIFCKGGNWVPADLLYSEVGPERTRELIRISEHANFNMLRVWGGGHFVDDVFLATCDERGILVWHDFLFACAKYPGDVPEFAAEVRREITHAVRERAHHPSLAVWCGNNEIEWGDWEWGYDTHYKTHPHYAIFHHDIPKIVREEAPATLHWLSSPWSPDFLPPNDPTVGDQHPWDVSIMQPGGADFWHYRTCVDRFPNEGGVLGASSAATLRQFLPPGEHYVGSPSWHHHDNPLAFLSGEPGAPGRAYQTITLWLDRDPCAMDMENYAFASAVLQAEGLTEYVRNYRRRMFSSASAIFWMYNDSWPATHGWTIVDYYLRRKLCYHPVRRAFAPITVVVARDDDRVRAFGVNDTREPLTAALRFGVFRLDGACRLEEMGSVTLAPNSATVLAECAFERLAAAGGPTEAGFGATLHREEHLLAQDRLLLARFHALAMPPPVIRSSTGANETRFEADHFVWRVCLDPEGELDLADDCFDLLPGVPYTVPHVNGQPLPSIARTGSDLLLSAGERGL